MPTCHKCGRKVNYLFKSSFCVDCPLITSEERPVFECDIEIYKCPYCQNDVIIYVMIDDSGIIPFQDYVLTAYHTECWDKQISEHSPNEKIINLDDIIEKGKDDEFDF
jgi:hypothetical protein